MTIFSLARYAFSSCRSRNRGQDESNTSSNLRDNDIRSATQNLRFFQSNPAPSESELRQRRNYEVAEGQIPEIGSLLRGRKDTPSVESPPPLPQYETGQEEVKGSFPGDAKSVSDNSAAWRTSVSFPLEERGNAVAQASQIINDKTDDCDRILIIVTIAALPIAEKDNAIKQSLRIINSGTRSSDRYLILQSIAALPDGERENAVTQALRLILYPTDEYMNQRFMQLVTNFPPAQGSNAAFRTLRLALGKADTDEGASIFQVVAHLPPDKREYPIIQAFEFINDQTNSRLLILKAVTDIAPDQRENTVTQALRLFNTWTLSDERHLILQTIATLPDGERENFVTQALRLINDRTLRDERCLILQTIATLPDGERENFVTQALRLINDRTLRDERYLILQTIAALPDGKRENFVTQALHLINDAADWHYRDNILRRVADIPPDQRESAVTQALRLINDAADGYARTRILDSVARLPPDQRESAVTQALRLINDAADGSHRARILWSIADLPPDQREYAVTQALRLINDTADGADRATILGSIAGLPSDQREYAVTQALRLINDTADGAGRATILGSIAGLPSDQREYAVTQALRLINNRTSLYYRYRILDSIADLPPYERTAAVNQALRAFGPEDDDDRRYEIINLIATTPPEERNRIVFDRARRHDLAWHEINQDIFQTSPAQIADAPLVMLQLYAESLVKGAANVRYVGSDGIDAGGVRRDFITRLLATLFPQERRLGSEPLQFIPDELGLAIPKAASENDPAHFNNVGIILGEILAGRLQATSGLRFSPLFFKMLHSLTQEEIIQQDNPEIQGSAYRKLLTIYCTARFGLSEEESRAIVLGNLPQRLQTEGVQNLGEFIDLIGFNAIASATLSVAGGIASRTSWDRDKKADPEELSETTQGRFSKEAVIHALRENYDSTQKRNLLRWLDESDEAQVRRFLFCISGSETLGSRPLNINAYRADGESLPRPSYHTCTRQIDLPQYNPPHDDYATFQRTLEESLFAAGRIEMDEERKSGDPVEDNPFQIG